MIAAITFDVWETMVRDNRDLSEQRSTLRLQRMDAVLRRNGVHVDEALLKTAYDDSWHHMERIWATGREVDTPEQVELILHLVDDTLAPKLDPQAWSALEEAYVNPIHDLPPLPADGLAAVLVELRQQGYRLGLVCNTGRTPGYAMRQVLGDRYGVLKHFDTLAFSNEEGVRKPDPTIFRRVLDELGVPPSKAAHVGDDLTADIAGAKRTGMRAVLIRDKRPTHLPAQPDAHIHHLSELPGTLRRL